MRLSKTCWDSLEQLRASETKAKVLLDSWGRRGSGDKLVAKAALGSRHMQGSRQPFMGWEHL